MKDLVFFNSADNGYEKFIIPYVYFANTFNPNATFEFLVSCKDYNALRDTIIEFKNQFKIDIILRNRSNSKISANKMRFLEQPLTNAIYTYIGDIDILICEDILNYNISKLHQYKTIIHNYIRPNAKNKLSGLQFCHYLYFQKSKQSRQYFAKSQNITNINDEILLKNIVDKSSIKIPNITLNTQLFTKLRKIHGIHLSQNRRPFKQSSMPINYQLDCIHNIKNILNSKEFKYVYNKYFSNDFKNIFVNGLKFLKLI